MRFFPSLEVPGSSWAAWSPGGLSEPNRAAAHKFATREQRHDERRRTKAFLRTQAAIWVPTDSPLLSLPLADFSPLSGELVSHDGSMLPSGLPPLALIPPSKRQYNKRLPVIRFVVVSVAARTRASERACVCVRVCPGSACLSVSDVCYTRLERLLSAATLLTFAR